MTQPNFDAGAESIGALGDAGGARGERIGSTRHVLRTTRLLPLLVMSQISAPHEAPTTDGDVTDHSAPNR